MIANGKDKQLKGASVAVSLSKEDREKCANWVAHAEEKTNWELFRDMDQPDVAYLLCHGDDKGYLHIGNMVCSTGEWLLRNIDDIKEKGISVILTVSCYGGVQKNFSYKGVSIGSIHTCPFEIYVRPAEDYSFETDDGIICSDAMLMSINTPEDGPFMRAGKRFAMRWQAFKNVISPKKVHPIEEILANRAKRAGKVS